MRKMNLFAVALISMFAFSLGVKAEEVSTTEELKSCLGVDGSTCTLKNDISDVTTLEVNGGSITLDLNGHNITFAERSRINVRKGNLNITGKGKISESVLASSPLAIYGSVNKEDTKYTTVTIGKDVTLYGLYGSFVSVSKDSAKKAHAYGVTVNINGTLIGDGAGFYVNGQLKDEDKPITVNISETAVLEGNNILYGAGYAIWNINGAKLSGNDSGIVIKSGKYNLTNTTVTTSGEKKTGVYCGDGFEATGSAIQIESNNGYVGEIVVNINGGTYISEKGESIYHYLAIKEGDTSDVKNSLLLLNIEDGSFTGKLNLLGDDKVTIKGGIFDTDVSEFVDSKYIAKKTDKGYEVVENKVITSSDNNVTFESDEAFDNIYSLSVEKVEDDVKDSLSEDTLKSYTDNKKIKDTKVIDIFDINLMVDGEIIPVEDGKFIISIAIDKSEQGYDVYKVVYYDEDGKVVETLDAKLVDGKVVFTTTHLSTYGIVAYNNVGTENPKTLDNIMGYVVFLIASLVGTSFVVLRKRYN